MYNFDSFMFNLGKKEVLAEGKNNNKSIRNIVDLYWNKSSTS